MTCMTFSAVRRGFRDILPVAIVVVPFGIAFGVAAGEKGLSPAIATAMSASVFAGAAQFAALEFWSVPLAVVPLLLVVFAVNARHLLLGASLFQWMRGISPAHRHAAAALLSDANFAYAIDRYRHGEHDVGVLLGSGLAMWIAWVLGTFTGAVLTNTFVDPTTLALDTLMVAFFATVLVSLAQAETAPWPWLVAAVSAVLGSWLLPPGWHILVGGIAGGLTGAFLHDR